MLFACVFFFPGVHISSNISINVAKILQGFAEGYKHGRV